MAADHSARIAEIQEILRAGASSVTTDGTTVTFDLASLRTELRQLMAEDANQRGRRPVVSSIYLGGF
jgi:hypothetical protein